MSKKMLLAAVVLSCITFNANAMQEHMPGKSKCKAPFTYPNVIFGKYVCTPWK